MPASAMDIDEELHETSNHRSLFIPVRQSDQRVEVFVDELPADVNDILDILRAEIAPLQIWLSFAIEYYKQHQYDQFKEILNAACEPGVEEIYNDDVSRISRLKIFNALAGHLIGCIWQEKDEKKRNELSQKAINLFQRADRIDANFATTLVGKGLMFLAKGEDDRAHRFLKSVLSQNKDNLAALLGQALLYFRAKKYADAKRVYERVIQLHPQTGPEHASRLRMCFGYCCYKLGGFAKAQAAMKRAIDLDESNVDASIAEALATLRERSAPEKEKFMSNSNSKYMHILQRAHLVNAQNPMVMNQLANHYFLQWTLLPGTFTVTQGSPVIHTSEDCTKEISAGQMLRIGQESSLEFRIANVKLTNSSVTSNSIVLDFPYPLPSTTKAHVYYKSYDQTLSFAGSAYHSTQTSEVQAESCYLMARALHAKGKKHEAYGYYFNAIRLWPEYSLAWYNLAQMYYEQGMVDKAVPYLEKSLRQYPDSVDVLMLSAKIASENLVHTKGMKKESNNKSKHENDDASSTSLGATGDPLDIPLRHYHRVIELIPDHIEARMGICDLLQSSMDPKQLEQAIAMYTSARDILESRLEVVPLALRVNLAVLYQRTHQTQLAFELYHVCLGLRETPLETMASDEQDEHDNANIMMMEAPVDRASLVPVTEENVVILYNLALLYESRGGRNQAKVLYEHILETFPSYVDAYCRLGCLERDQGRDTRALAYFSQALEVNPKHANACALMANVHLRKREWNVAQKLFEKIMGFSSSLKNDPYVLLSMGNIYMSNLDERLRKNLGTSIGFYKKSLQIQPSNVYAANGVGIYLAESGHLDGAKQIFSKVREAQPELPDAWINLAHIYMAEEKYPEAIQLYARCLEQCYANLDTEVMLYLAKAHFEAKNYLLCIQTLTRALHLDPTDLRLWYNLGLALEDFAVGTLGQEIAKKTGIRRTLADVERAVQDLIRAQRIFTFLARPQVESSLTSSVSAGERASSSAVAKLPYNKEKAIDHANFCEGTKDKASVHLEFERSQEEKRKKEALAQEKISLEFNERKQRQLEQEQARMSIEAQKRQELALKKEERLEQLNKSWSVQQTAVGTENTPKKKQTKSSKTKAKRKQKDMLMGSDDSGSSDVDSEEDEEAPGASSTSGGKLKSEGQDSTLDKLMRKRQKMTEQDLFGGSSSSEDESPITAIEESRQTPDVVESTESPEAKKKNTIEADLFGSDSSDED